MAHQTVAAAAAPALRVPPHNAEAERGVLGSILLDSTRVMDLCLAQGLLPESFYVPQNRTLFTVLIEMQRAGTVIDMITVSERLRVSGLLQSVGGPSLIEELVDQTPTSAHAEYYIELVHQKHLLRCIIDCAREAEAACYESRQGADYVLSNTEQSFLNITERQRGFVGTWPKAVNDTVSHISKLLDLGPGGISGLPTGLHNLDATTRGLRGGEMIVLAARPSMGKTSLAMNIAECVALGLEIGQGKTRRPLVGDHARPHSVAVFSLEMSQEALALRMLCGMAGVSSYKIESGMVSNKSVGNEITRAASQLSKAPLYVDDTGGLDVMELRARARRMKKKYNIELIVIDYLQMLNCREFARQGRQQETSAISSNVKAMAKELKIPVIVLSQLSRAPEQRGDKSNRPKLSDLRDSGAIEQDADVVLLLRRPCKSPGDEEHGDTNLAIVDIAKNRNGPTGEVRLNFDETLTRFHDRAHDRGPAADDSEPDRNDVGM